MAGALLLDPSKATPAQLLFAQLLLSVTDTEWRAVSMCHIHQTRLALMFEAKHCDEVCLRCERL
jgi:hypothetical protein